MYVITIARLVPASRMRTARITSPAAVQTMPSTITDAIAPAVGVWEGASTIAAGVRIAAEIASEAPIIARASTPSRRCLISIGPIE